MIETKYDIKKAIADCENNNSLNVNWAAGYITAMKEILDSWWSLYDSQKFAYAMEDAQDHLWDFFSDEVCLTDDECDKRIDQALADGTIAKIARSFLNNHDCNVAENDQYVSIIHDMFPDESNTYEYKEISL